MMSVGLAAFPLAAIHSARNWLGAIRKAVSGRQKLVIGYRLSEIAAPRGQVGTGYADVVDSAAPTATCRHFLVAYRMVAHTSRFCTPRMPDATDQRTGRRRS